MEIICISIDEVIPYARNPRRNADAVEKVAASIREFGFRQPLVVDAHNVIVVGHTRYLAAKKLKMATVPVHVAKDLSPIKAKAYRLADNRTHDEAKWDDELLALELGELGEKKSGIDIELTGFDLSEIEQFLSLDTDGDGVDENEESTKEQYGVMIVCESEAEQQQAYKKLAKQGFNCRMESA